MPNSPLIRLVFLAQFLIPSANAASGDWSLCKTPALAPVAPAVPLTPDTPMEFDADEARFDPGGVSVLSGSVVLRRGDQELHAKELRFDHAANQISADVDVDFSDRGFTISAAEAEFLLNTNEARFAGTRYRYGPRHAQGTAQEVTRDTDGVLTLMRATYTTCDPGDPDWLLSARKVKLDRDSGEGTARSVVFRYQGLPFVYLPWISFPIDDRRKSGFLVPVLGTSSETGLTLETPYYWNIAPQRDATLTPRLLAQRGAQLRSEFRFLTPRSDGTLGLEYLNDTKFNDDRYLWSVDARRRFTGRLSGDLDLHQVSDSSYFEDLGNSLSVTSTTHLPRRGDLLYLGNGWNLRTRLESFQTVDASIAPINEPYRRLPQIVFNAAGSPGLGLDYGLRSEWVSFDRDAGITGERLDLSLSAGRPLEGAGYFFRPAAELKFTDYSLDGVTTGIDVEPRRTVPVLSVDSGLIFERGSRRALQTVEPRLYYLYVPFRQQDAIPTFDTGRLDFSFSQLFRDDRFTGADRVGDANQLTLGLTTRLLDLERGGELLSASGGQIFYFEDRRVTLPGELADTRGSSDLAGELALHPHRDWTVQGSLLWNPQLGRTQRGTVQLLYGGENNRIVNLSYRLRRDQLEQTDLAFSWPLSPRWRVLGRWNRSLRDSQDLEILAGFEYESCCYKLRFAHRQFVNDATSDLNRAYLLQLVLKGLTSVGAPLDTLLERGILGYEAND